MEVIKLFCLLLLFGCCVQSRPWLVQSDAQQILEEAADFSARGAQRRARAAVGEVCKSVIAEPHGLSLNTAVHLCQNESGICYFSALEKCCSNIDNAFPVGDGVTINFGERCVPVQFFYSGGFGSGDPLRICVFIADDTIEFCEIPFPCKSTTRSCEETSEVCVANTQLETCDPATGCRCKSGYRSPDCCKCDTTGVEHEGQMFFKSGDLCLPLCQENCLRPGSHGTGCNQCQPGYQGASCCNCSAERVRVGLKCVCPSGSFESALGGCKRCREDQVRSGDECVCPIGEKEFDGKCEAECLQFCLTSGAQGCFQCRQGYTGKGCCQCSSNLVKVNGRCVCAEGLQTASGRCLKCRADQVLNSDLEICTCPYGRVESNGRCCPYGHIHHDGRCVAFCVENCEESSMESGCSQCLQGYRTEPLCCGCNSDRVAVGHNCECPLDHTADSNGDCVCIGELEKDNQGMCGCKAGHIRVGSKCKCPEDREEDSNGNCVCTGDLTESVMGTCECRAGRIRVGSKCECPGDREEDPNGNCVCIGQLVEDENGDCRCGVGRIRRGPKCECLENREEDLNGRCVCTGELTEDEDGNCGCEIGYIQMSSKCKCPNNREKDLNGECVCIGELVENERGQCGCRSGHVQVGSKCECPTDHMEDTNGDCICVGELQSDSNGPCRCPDGHIRVGSKCECPNDRVEDLNGSCVCSGELVEDENDECNCKTGYVRVGSKCRCPDDYEKDPSGNCVCTGEFERNKNGDCTCRVGLIRVGSKCECPNGHEKDLNGHCVCPGELEEDENGECKCRVGHVQVGSECECQKDREKDSNGNCVCVGELAEDEHGVCGCRHGRTRVGSECRCTKDREEDSDGKCVCPGDLQEDSNGDCRCSDGSIRDGNNCVSDIPCGENQDIYFILDITQSFDVARLYRVIRALQLIIGAVNSHGSGLRVAVVHYPYIFNPGPFSPRNISTNFVVNLDTACSEAVKKLDSLALSLSGLQSEGTNVSSALEFVSEHMSIDKPAAVFTLISGTSDGHTNDPSSGYYPINTIKAAIDSIQAKTGHHVRFFAAGDSTNIRSSLLEDFGNELKALSDDVSGNYMKSGSIITLINQALDILTNGKVLCSDQANVIRSVLLRHDKKNRLDIDLYAKCIEDFTISRSGSKIPNCFSTDTCSPLQG